MPYFVNDGLSLYYEVHGSGPPVVMLHGAAVSFAGNFGACGWIDRMTGRGLQVVGLDSRGHGSSAKVYDSALYGTDVLSSDVIALLDHLAIERASVVGYSIGSAIALHLLHAHPKRFIAGALVATGDGLIGLSPLTFPAILPRLAETLRRPEFPTDLPPHVAVYWTFATQIAGDREAVAAGAGADYPPCAVAEAESVYVPVLVVSGDGDLVLGTGSRLAATIPRGRYFEIAGADHFSLALDESVQTAVAGFLAEAG